MRYENPPNLLYIKFCISMLIVVIIISILMLSSKIGLWDGWSSPLILIGGWSIMLFGVWYQEYYTRPQVIDVVNDGLILSMKYTGLQYVKWNEIIGYFSYQEDKIGKENGLLLLKSGSVLRTSTRISKAIANQYEIVMGAALPEIGTNENLRSFKKRIGNPRF
ncbi:MAG: hypothetical protein LLG16_03355 [Euryarchaeota archaeon]|nr:hypothetical protein [Euryarchaeota archaeon]